MHYLEAVLDVVARLADAHRLQHAGVAQLPQHQVVAEPQGQLGRKENTRKDAVRGRMDDTWRRKTSNSKVNRDRSYLVGVGADALDEVGLRLTQSLHQLVERGLRVQGTQGVNAEPRVKAPTCRSM